MTETLPQSEADRLLAMAKRPEDESERSLPDLGGHLEVPLVSLDGREAFTLDVWRSRINLVKGRYQHRGRHTIILARLDFGAGGHRNPDGEEMGVPHLHLYREGFGDKWAFPVPADRFPNLADRWQTLLDFIRFCAIEPAPRFKRGLFS